jgi:hypothetical protein
MKTNSINTILITLCFSVSAYAADDTSGFFVKSGLGATLISPDTKSETTIPNWATDPAFSWTLGGGYRLNRYFGIEGGFRDFGEGGGIDTFSHGNHSHTNKTKLGFSAWTIGGFATYEILPTIELNTHAGWYAWHFKGKYEANLTTPNFNDSQIGKVSFDSNDPYVGAGASWSLNKNISLGLDWTYFIVTGPVTTNDDSSSINTFEITGRYQF